MNQDLHFYLQKITQIKRGGTNFGAAPHKPVLLLTLIDAIDERNIIDNRIPVDNFLFQKIRENWKLLVTTGNKCDPTLPLHHLRNDGLWFMVTKNGEISEKKYSSQKSIIQNISHSQFSSPLFKLLLSFENRDLFRMVILDTFFPDSKLNYYQKMPELFLEIESEILEESQSKIRKVNREYCEFIRDEKFKFHVKKIYNYTCCISGMKVDPYIPIIEACHIKPHGQFGIQGVKNGIPLCANLHKAFDYGLIGISDDYTVLVSPKFQEENSSYKISQFNGNSILLPSKENHYPSLENIRWHRQKFGF